MNREAFRAGWLDYHRGSSRLSSWAGWKRAAEEQDSRHWERTPDGVYVYVQMPRHPWVADLTPANSSGWGEWAR